MKSLQVKTVSLGGQNTPKEAGRKSNMDDQTTRCRWVSKVLPAVVPNRGKDERAKAGVSSLGAVFLIGLLASALSEAAQPPTVEWERTFGGASGDSGYCVRQTADGGYVVVGGTSSFSSTAPLGANVYLIKVEGDGHEQWQKLLGEGPEMGSITTGRSIAQTPDGGYIIAGVLFTPHDGMNVCLIKADTNGNQLWQQVYGLNPEDPSEEIGESVDLTTDGGFIVAGHGTPPTTASVQLYLLKTNSSGTLQWFRHFGGGGSDEGYCARQTTDGGYIVAGLTGSYGAGNDDLYLIKTDSSGTLQWEKTFGGTLQDRGRSVLQTPDGGYIVAGMTNSFHWPDIEVYLVKTDSSGTLQWEHTFNGGRDAYCIQPTADGGYIVAGMAYVIGRGEEVYLLKTDRDGMKQWETTLGGVNDDQAYCVRQTTDGGFLVVGQTQSFGAGSTDVYIVKLAPRAMATGFWTLYD